MININDCEPKDVLRFFYELSAIPHGSKNMQAISDYCVEFANERSLAVTQDSQLNVIITKPATKGYEKEEPIIIQGHLDMVCEKEEGYEFDFENEGLKLQTDGNYLWAEGTTLGGDDGVAIAMALAVLDSNELQHPLIEAVFTTDEEIGLVGASKIDLSNLQGKRMINIDSSDEGIITTSCAGGSYMSGMIPVETSDATGRCCRIIVSGLVGGHSGCDIHRGRANANQLMGRVLYQLRNKVSLAVVSVEGGKKDNVIPNYTVAEIIIDKDSEDALKNEIKEIETILQQEYKAGDPELALNYELLDIATNEVLSKNSLDHLLQAVLNFPNGIQQMSGAIAGLVETSLNMGVLVVNEKGIHLQYGIRSSIESAKEFLVEKLKFAILNLGGTYENGSDYPGWAYKSESPLREKVVKIYTNQYGEEPEITAIHAGLECGIFAAKIEGLDCVAIGPNLYDIHSPKERLELKSLERTWSLLKGILKDR